MLLDMLNVLGTREIYDRFSPIIKDGMLSKDGEVLVRALGKYYEKYDTATIDWDQFAQWFTYHHRRLYNKEQMETYSTIIDKIKKHTVDDSIIKEVFATVISEDYAAQIHNIALKVISGDDDYGLEDVADKLKMWEDEIEKYAKEEPEWLDMSDIERIVNATVGTGGLEWRLDGMNVSLGPLRKGHFVIIGARPDAGKTTFLVSNVVHWAKQISNNECILWLNNEETAEKVGTRMVSSAIMWTDQEIADDPMGAQEKFAVVVGDPKMKIRQIKQTTFTTREVDAYCKKFKPSIIIFDQLWKVLGFEKETANETMRQSMLFAWARGLANRYGPTLTVHQLGGEAEGEKFPTMNMLYGSQTGIQGEADLIIMLGKSKDAREQDYRFLSFPKNKMGSGPRCDKTKRNARYLLKVDYDHACFEEVEEYVVT